MDWEIITLIAIIFLLMAASDFAYNPPWLLKEVNSWFTLTTK